MNKDKSFHDYVLNDLFSELDGVTSRAMFGGYSFYYSAGIASDKRHMSGKIFGIIANGKLYFKVGDGNRQEYEDAGSKPFTYSSKNGKVYAMSYWEVPPDALEDKLMLLEYVEKAVAESQRIKKK